MILYKYINLLVIIFLIYIPKFDKEDIKKMDKKETIGLFKLAPMTQQK